MYYSTNTHNMFSSVYLIQTTLLLGSALVIVCGLQPLILSPLVKAGKIAEAQRLARVVPDMGGEKSYSGYLTTNQDCGNNLFFWFFTAQRGWEQAPVLLWLNGGPGCSSLIGLFTEVGPFSYSKEKKNLIKNQYTWTKDNNVIFLDQPVGTGFSFTTGGCYADNLTMMAEEVYSFLEQFFMLFPNIKNNRFFITGESFTGHYAPAIALEIHKRNTKNTNKINMIGIFIGNPLIDVKCEILSNAMYELGILDEKGRKEMDDIEKKLIEAVNDKDFDKAYDEEGQLFNAVRNTSLPSVYNVLYDKDVTFDFSDYIQRLDIRKKIHVGCTPYFVCGDLPFEHILVEQYISTVTYIEELLKSKRYLVAFYSGLLDLRVSYTSTECALRELRWDGAEEYLSAKRSPWYVGRRLAGWVKVAGNLCEVAVRGAGHTVPTDQPAAALALITAILNSQPGNTPLSTLNTSNINS